jgi:hypothetical protein
LDSRGLLGTSSTPSPVSSLALNGNFAYVCGSNEVSVLDVSNPASPLFLGAALASITSNDGVELCSIQRNSLLAFVDAVNSQIGNSPAFAAFDLQNPSQPQLIKGAAVNKRFFADLPVYAGSIAYVNTTDPSNPLLIASLESPSAPASDGPNPMHGVALANSQTLYAAGTTSTGASNNGTGKLVVADISNLNVITTVTTVPVPLTKDLFQPVIQGNLAVAIGDDGGYAGQFTPTTVFPTWATSSSPRSISTTLASQPFWPAWSPPIRPAQAAGRRSSATPLPVRRGPR